MNFQSNFEWESNDPILNSRNNNKLAGSWQQIGPTERAHLYFSASKLTSIYIIINQTEAAAEKIKQNEIDLCNTVPYSLLRRSIAVVAVCIAVRLNQLASIEIGRSISRFQILFEK